MKNYRLTAVTVELDVERLVYAEAVQTADGVAPVGSEPFSVPLDAGQSLRLSIYRGVLSESDLHACTASLKSSLLTVAGRAIRTGGLRERQPVILAPHGSWNPETGATLHPDGRHTFSLVEWWDEDEHLLRQLEEGGHLKEIGTAIRERIEVDLLSACDRIGNVRVLDRLSNWYIDTKPDNHRGTRWIRALHDGPLPTVELSVHFRFTSGNDVSIEEIQLLPMGGLEVGSKYQSGFSISLFDRQTGKLLARELAELSTEGSVSSRIGHAEQAVVTDSSGVQHTVEWINYGSRHPRTPGGPPWIARTRTRATFNERTRESWRVKLFREGERPQALKHIRTLLNALESPYVYFWDPYFDAPAAQDVLPWVRPSADCRILTCVWDQKNSLRASTLGAELIRLRSGPPPRTLAAKARRKGQSAIYHDRCIIAEGEAWVLGSSLNSIGDKWALVMELLDPDRLRRLFEEEWSRQPGSFQEQTL